MKTISSLALVLALALPVSSLAAAQDRAGPPPAARAGRGHGGFGPQGHHGLSPERIEHKVQMLTIMLRLDATQQRLVREIAAQVATELRAARDANPRVPGAHRQILERGAERIDAILNSQQREIFDRMREVVRARRGAHEGRPGHGPREGRQGARGGRGQGARLGARV